MRTTLATTTSSAWSSVAPFPTVVQHVPCQSILLSTMPYVSLLKALPAVELIVLQDQVAQRAKMHLRESDGVTTLHDVHPDLVYTMVGGIH